MTTIGTGAPTPATLPGRGGRPAGRHSITQRAARILRGREEPAWRAAARIASIVPLGALAFTLTVLAVKAWPAIRVNGAHFLTGTDWRPGSAYGAVVRTHGVAHPAGSSYGAWALIAGTLQTSAIAIVIAVPVSVGAAFALTERLPGWLARPLGLAIETLAGIPSVIVGLWGALTLGPFLAQHVYPFVAGHVPDVPVLRYFRGPTGHGEGLLTSGIVLALMIVPIIASTARDLFAQVPPLPKEGAQALGMTDAEVARWVTLPWVRSGLVGATILGLGRALGETIAVAMVSGSVIAIAPNMYGNMTTIAATIVSQLDSAATDGTGFATATLAEAGLVLAIISVVVNVLARRVIARSSRLGLPVGSAA
ncbi:MAG TPA: phosphate ABC transporter permease subunit PstC [Acidimicrobiales bacterium]|nr:phosphate ABC transporter permease subunit PstC [Acidimicrobiales bacterium]